MAREHSSGQSSRNFYSGGNNLPGNHRKRSLRLRKARRPDADLQRDVVRFANALKQLGVGKGTKVAIYMGMVPETAIGMLACARLGATHSVIFGGFSAESVAERMDFSQAKCLVTVDGARRKGKTAPIKATVDEHFAAAAAEVLAALREGLGSAWADTLVIVATEFGRTAAINGTGGTDHGTGGLAMLLGGTVRGGRVLADWPGLGQSALHEGRDLRPTTPLDTVLTGAIASHFGLEPTLAAQTLFPGGTGKALSGLIRT